MKLSKLYFKNTIYVLNSVIYQALFIGIYRSQENLDEYLAGVDKI